MDVYKKVTKPPVLDATTPTPILTPPAEGSNIGVAPLITMIAVLAIILIFCFCGAPAVRRFCLKRVCNCCRLPDEERPNLPRQRTSVVNRDRELSSEVRTEPFDEATQKDFGEPNFKESAIASFPKQ